MEVLYIVLQETRISDILWNDVKKEANCLIKIQENK